MKTIKLQNSEKELILDDIDFSYFSRFKWYLSKDGYAYRQICFRGNSQFVFVHQLIIQGKQGTEISHRNKNNLDNRKSNLFYNFVGTNSHRGYKAQEKSSIYKGVCKRKNHDKWVANIKKQGVQYSLGTFNSEIDAAKAYNKKALELFGEFAYQNIV